MSQLLSFWSRMNLRRRIVVSAATAVMFIAILLVARLATAPSLALLYAGLDPAAAGAIVQALERQGATYEVRGDSVWVHAQRRDALRMELAADGLPASGGAGYELLDQLSGFGTTARMFDAAYLRAKEGELARTIMANPAIRSARVHLAQPEAQPFRREVQPSASVSIVAGASAVTTAQAQAIRHLVAASVPGLVPERVAIIDSRIGLIPLADATATGDSRAEVLKQAVERLLAARVGSGRAQVEIAIDFINEREAITERRFDPQGRVVISSESEERTNSATGAPPAVTIASNLPEGDAAPRDGSRSHGNETRERVNYEVSETAREVVRAPGGIRRLTVAVLVDGIRAADGSWQPRPAEELDDLRELVAAAVGFDAARGDDITLKSLEFEPFVDLPATGLPSYFATLDPMMLVQLATLLTLVLSIVFFVIRPLLRSPRVSAELAPLALAADEPAADALPPLFDAMPMMSNADDTTGGVPSLFSSEVSDDPVARLRNLISERQTESLAILRRWMEDPEEAEQ